MNWNEPADFRDLVDQAMEQPGRQAMRPVIEKELLHLDILYALDTERLLDNLTFQGGTSLRLCHGAARFSEDLAFAGGRDFKSRDVVRIKACIEAYVSRRYGLEVTVKQPRELRAEPSYAEIRVDKWQVAVVTAPARPDIPKQRIKLDIANVPAYTRETRGIKVHYPFLPDGYDDLLVIVESMEEVMADKLVSLVNTQKYIRYRDIWDVQWLRQQGAELEPTLVRDKIRDYGVVAYAEKAERLMERLPKIVSGPEMHKEMRRFLPQESLARTFDRSGFRGFLSRETVEILRSVVASLNDDHPRSPQFRL